MPARQLADVCVRSSRLRNGLCVREILPSFGSCVARDTRVDGLTAVGAGGFALAPILYQRKGQVSGLGAETGLSEGTIAPSILTIGGSSSLGLSASSGSSNNTAG